MVGKRLLLSVTFGLLAGCGIHPESKQRMNLQDILASVRNDRIKFATMRPPGSQFASLDRRVIVTGSPELVELSASNDPQVLSYLVELLGDRDRAWAAEVLLARKRCGSSFQNRQLFGCHPKGSSGSVGRVPWPQARRVRGQKVRRLHSN